MKTEQRLYLSGILLSFIIVISAQLIWLMDPIKVIQGQYWLESLEYVIWFTSVVPLMWGVATVFGLISSPQNNQYPRKQKLLRNLNKWILLIFILTLIIILISLAQQWFWLGLFLSLCYIGVWMNLFFDEKIQLGKITKKLYILFAASIFLLFILLYPMPFIVTYPGLSMNMDHYAKVEKENMIGEDGSMVVGEVLNEVNGEILGVLVFERPAFPIDWIYARLFPGYDFAKRLPTDEPLSERLRSVKMSMLNANDIAKAIAFKEAGIGKGFTKHGVRVVSIVEDAPALNVLLLGDIIVATSNATISSTKEFIQSMNEVKPGEWIAIKVLRENKVVPLDILTRAHPENSEQAVIGAQLIDEIHIDLPLHVDFNNYMLHVGGPSHGAMLTLTLLNQLTIDDLTHGLKVAGTGTIGPDGSIGPIGGIKQKVYTIERTGADVFFVPEQQLAQARESSTNLRIIPVKTFSDILSWLDDVNDKQS